MTCIAGWIENDNVWIGGDSSNNYGPNQTTRATPKVFTRTEDGIEWLFGCSGLSRSSQIIKYELTLPSSEDLNEKDVCEFVVTKLIPRLRETLFKNGFLEKEKGVEKMDGVILVGVKGHLFIIDDIFYVRETVENFVAIGSGGAIARGVLYATKYIESKKPLTPEERILLALKAAEENIQSVAGPFHVISSAP